MSPSNRSLWRLLTSFPAKSIILRFVSPSNRSLGRLDNSFLSKSRCSRFVSPSNRSLWRLLTSFSIKSIILRFVSPPNRSLGRLDKELFFNVSDLKLVSPLKSPDRNEEIFLSDTSISVMLASPAESTVAQVVPADNSARIASWIWLVRLQISTSVWDCESNAIKSTETLNAMTTWGRKIIPPAPPPFSFY